ncbi:MAG: 4-hydroxy-tetrahydrodipicolinate reductase [Clostridia bacterium]|nr:4-hydroxy-tetrahydrodipicolinate reductase [Clostridia bacterium]
MTMIVNGAGGRLGAEVLKAAKAAGYAVVAVDKSGVSGEATTYSSLAEYAGAADVVIDFSSHLATRELLDYVTARRLPLVLATTGQTDEERQMIYDAAKVIPLFFSANMSYGVALLLSLVKRAAALLPEDDVEIVETHHNHKADAPSGTAIMIANAISDTLGGRPLVKGRNGIARREKGEIGISSIRIGSVVGKHEVMFSDGVETLTVTHEAHDKALFAAGAVRAATFLLGKEAGLYDMQSLVEATHA